MKGIQNLQAAILLAVAFANQIHESASDGFKPADLFDFIDEAMQIQGVVASKDEIVAELNDLSLEERGQIIDAVAQKLNVGNDKAEGVVADAIDWLAASYKLGKSIAA
jgi:hypothetical protein